CIFSNLKYYGSNLWFNTNLVLYRRAYRFSFASSGSPQHCTAVFAFNNMQILSKIDQFNWQGCSYSNQTTQTNTLGILTVANPPPPSISDYQITDNFFGSINIGGVQYTWEKK